MNHSIQQSLRFPPVAGLTVLGEFDCGALSSGFAPRLLRGIDRQIGLTECLAQAFRDSRHPSYITQVVSDTSPFQSRNEAEGIGVSIGLFINRYEFGRAV